METKIIKAVFGNQKSIVTIPRMQYDYGQVIDVVDISLPATFEARFSNQPTGESVRVIGENQQVAVPDKLLENAGFVWCYITVHDEVTDGRTMYTMRIPVKPASERTDAEPTPVQQDIITQAIAMVNTAVDTTSQKASEASDSADRAEQAADGIEAYVERAESAQQAAESARDIALEAKVSAQASAATASEKASEAINSATTASQSALTAETASESAQEYATASAVSASASAVSASQASEHASTAGSKATEASQKASEASQSASIASARAIEADTAAGASIDAKNDAVTAQTAAQTAKTQAESARDEAQECATRAETAAKSIDFGLDPVPTRGSNNAVSSGGVYSALVEIEADVSDIQTAISTEVKSKNLINPDALTVGRLLSSGITDTMSTYKTSDYILLDVGEYVFAREKLSDSSAMATGYSGYGFYDLNKTWVADSRVWGNWTAGTVLSFTVPEKCYIRVSGNKDYFTDDDKGLFILQSGTALDGYEPYHEPQREYSVVKKSDIEQTAGESKTKLMSQKAIKEFVEASAGGDLDEIAPYIVGKNKYNPAECNPQNGVAYNSSGEIITGANYAITGKMPVEAKTTYIFSATERAMQYTTICYFSGENGETFINRETINGSPFTTPENCSYIGINLFGRTHTEQDFTDAIAVAQLELGNIVTAYEPYSEKRMVSPSNILGGENIEALGEVTETQSQINLYDKNLAVDGKYLYGKTNTIQSSENYAYSGRIPVKPNRQYNISIDPTSPLKLSGVVFTFDANGNKLANASLSNYVYSYLLSFATGADVRFISFNMSKDAHTAQEFEDTINTLMLCYGTIRPLTYSEYNAESVIDVSKLSDAYVANRDCFSGKKWLATGTSITWYDGKVYSAGVHTGEICRGYVGRVSRRKHLLVTNEGISGSTLANVSESSLINRYTSLDWANTDIATIEYGVNDFGHAVEIGTAEDPAGTNTFAACLKTVIEYALAQNPSICLVICTEPDVRGNTANTGGHYLKEYTDVTLATAEQYRLPVCDWYYKSGINALNKGDSSTDKMTADGTHPNDKGHMRMGAMLNQVFDSLLC